MPMSFSSRPARPRWALAAALLLAITGCADLTEPTPQPALAASAALPSAFAGAEIQDVLERVLPALEDEAAARELELALTALLDVLSRGEPAAVAPALVGAERALAVLERGAAPGSGDLVHGDVIELALAGLRSEVAIR